MVSDGWWSSSSPSAAYSRLRRTRRGKAALAALQTCCVCTWSSGKSVVSTPESDPLFKFTVIADTPPPARPAVVGLGVVGLEAWSASWSGFVVALKRRLG
jgi:hypothetical protein